MILASSSPRRRALLRAGGVVPEVLAPDVDEAAVTAATPAGLVERLALAKATAVAARRPGRVVLGADTVVVRDDVVLGKPVDADDATAMLTAAAGRWSAVLSGVAVVGRDGLAAVGHVRTELRFHPLDAARVAAHVALGEWRDAAGGFRIQSAGADLVADRRGCWGNVVGLPTCLAADLLAPHDVALRRDDCPPPSAQ